MILHAFAAFWGSLSTGHGRMPGGGKMGVNWDAFSMAAFHVNLWLLALTSPVRSIQGLPSLEIAGVNLHKMFSGKDGQPWKCKLVVAAWPVLPMGKSVDAEFRAAVVPSCWEAGLGRVYGHPPQCSHGQQLSAWLLELWTMTPFQGGFSWGHKGFVLARGELSPLVWSVLPRCLPSSTNSLAHEHVRWQAVKTEVFLGCCLSSQGFFYKPCSGVACSCWASHIADASGFPQPPSWAKTGQQQPLGAQCPVPHCFSTSQTTHPCMWGAWTGQPRWSHRVSWGSVGQNHIFCAEDLKAAAVLLVSNFTPWGRGKCRDQLLTVPLEGVRESFCRRHLPTLFAKSRLFNEHNCFL